jgi:ATP synthase protein I
MTPLDASCHDRAPGGDKRRRQAATEAPRTGVSGVGPGIRAVSSFLSGPLVWGGIGWLADHLIGTWPWLMSTGVLVGFAAGMYLLRHWMGSPGGRSQPGVRDDAKE